MQRGLDALGWYHEKKDENRNIGLGPAHDWSSPRICYLTLKYVADIADIGRSLRACITGRYDAPNLSILLYLCGKDRCLNRIDGLLNKIKFVELYK